MPECVAGSGSSAGTSALTPPVDAPAVAPGVGVEAASERIRLLKFVTLFAIGGTERQVVNLAKGMDRARVDLRLACLNRVGELLPECDAEGWSITEYRIHRLYGYETLKRQWEFACHLRRDGIQVLHTYGFYPNVFALPAARAAGVPVVIGSVRDTGNVWSRWQHEIHKICLRLATHVIVNAEAVRRDLMRRGYAVKGITVIPNGIDCERFRVPGSGEAVRRDWGIPLRVPVVGVLSRLLPQKGHDYFLQAAAVVAARHPDVRFVLVGDTKINEAYRDHLKRLVAALGLQDRVLFTGFRMDVPQLLRALTVSVLPSLGEGLSNALLESMAAGVPVVATTAGGNPEIVEDGVTGLLVPPADAAALASAICRLLETPALAARCGEAGRRLVWTQYSLEQAVIRTERLYADLLRERSGRRWRPAA